MGERKYWNPEMETMPREKMIKLQGGNLRSFVKHAYENTSFYQKLYDEAGVKPEDIQSLEDIVKLPTFCKDDLRRTARETGDPFAGMLAVPPTQIYRWWTSTGTTGAPSIPLQTKEDFLDAVELNSRIHWMVGARPGDPYLFIFFRANADIPNIQMSMENIGCPIINLCTFFMPNPGLPSELERVIYTLKKAKERFGNRRAILGMGTGPFYGLVAYLKSQGMDPLEVFGGIKATWLAGDILLKPVREQLERDIGCGVFEYGGGAELAWILECEAHEGLHTQDDLVYLEILDPETHKPVAPGEMGELTATSFWLRGTPYIRFRVEDIVNLNREPCTCGRTTTRVTYFGRMGQKVCVQGKDIYARHVAEALRSNPETDVDDYHIVIYKKPVQETLRIKSTFNEALTKDKEELKRRVEKQLQEKLGVPTEIEWIKKEEVIMSMHKVLRMIDLTKAH